MQRALSSFPLAPTLISKLNQAGYTILEDINDLKPSELSKETGLSVEEALEVTKTVKNASGSRTSIPTFQSAREICEDEQGQKTIITFCKSIDDMLGGGVPVGKVTEICGAPGIGKTQLCMQLCVDVQIKEMLGGMEGESVYIDTEGSFTVERLVEIADATIQHCGFMAESLDNEDSNSLDDFTLENVLQRIYYFRCHNYVELLANIFYLTEFLKDHKKVKLVVVDSVAFHFRHDFDDLSLRTRLLTSMAQDFIRLAKDYNLAVVLANQMTTKVSSDSQNSKLSHLSPALGESWGHASTLRLVLHWVSNVRYALLYKSPSQVEKDVPYQITTGGIRDIILNDDEEDEEDDVQMPSKRQRTV